MIKLSNQDKEAIKVPELHRGFRSRQSGDDVAQVEGPNLQNKPIIYNPS
jgi:hypothetical protein